MKRDTVTGTLLVALVLCVVCSVVVAGAAVGLRPFQEANKRLDQRRNVLIAAGRDVDELTNDQIEAMFDDPNQIERELVDLSTGEVVSEDDVDFDLDTYDPRAAAKSSELSEFVHADGASMGIARREKYAFVFKLKSDGKVDKYVIPIYGKGLWSTLYGYLALENDLKTVAGITFYEHKETPGLGGEVENPGWKALWPGKELYDAQWNVDFQVIKGQVDPNSANAAHQVDGLSGATITSRGVSNLVQYWIGTDGFGKYLENVRNN